MPNLITDASTSSLAVISAEKATTPPSLSDNQAGNTVVLPRPPGIKVGYLMLAAVAWNNFLSPITPPTGWVEILNTLSVTSSINFRVYSKVATGDEPASYTWTGPNGNSRSGCILLLRGASLNLVNRAVSGQVNGSPIPCPTVSNPIPGSMLVTIVGALETVGPVEEEFAATPPLVMQVQHASRGGVAYSSTAQTAIAIETNLSAGTISGRQFTHSGSSLSNPTSMIVLPGGGH